jgi:arylsulfatase A-like enzyme
MKQRVAQPKWPTYLWRGVWQRFVITTCFLPLYADSQRLTAEQPRRDDRPNVLFVVIDDLRCEMGCWGNDYMVTPNLDRVAASGVRFTRAYCQQALCHPSRNSVLSGLRPDVLTGKAHASYYRQAQPDVISLPQCFKSHGYVTRCLGKVLHHNGLGQDRCQPQYDPLSWSEPMFWPKTGIYALRPDVWTRCQLERRTGIGLAKADKPLTECADVADDAYRDGMVASEAIRTMRRFRDRPFFLAVGFYRPHTPFAAPKKYWDLYDPTRITLAANPHPPHNVPPLAMYDWKYIRSFRGIPESGPIPNEMARHLLHAYYASISYMDAQLGRVVDELQRLDLADKTLIVIWSDHGYQMGEHGIWGKHTNFEDAVLTPVIIQVPGQRPRGVVCQGLIELVDLYPTICELCGLETPEHVQGTSFALLLDEPDRAWKPAAFSQYGRGRAMGRSIRTERYRFTQWQLPSGETVAQELYDHEHDPGEDTNLADAPQFQELIGTLQAMLHAGWQAARSQSRGEN